MNQSPRPLFTTSTVLDAEEGKDSMSLLGSESSYASMVLEGEEGYGVSGRSSLVSKDELEVTTGVTNL